MSNIGYFIQQTNIIQDTSLLYTWCRLLITNHNLLMADHQYLITDAEQVDDRVFFSLLQKAGTMGNYQKITTVFWCIVGYLCGGLMLITPFLFYQDPYKCDQTYPNQTCFQHVCSLADPNERLAFIKTPTMRTLANQFGDFRCEKEKLELDFVITLMYVGTVVGSLILTMIGDLVGRKRLMIACLATNLIGLGIVIFSVDIRMAAAGLFLSTVGVQTAFNVCFYFLSQIVAQSHRQKFSVGIQLFYGLGVVSNVLWYYLVRDWQIIMGVFYFAPSLLALVAVVAFVKDTPICLITRYSPTQALKAFSFIAKINRISQLQLKIEQVDRLKTACCRSKSSKNQKQNRFSVVDLFRFKSLRMVTLLLIFLQCIIIFQFYAPALMMDQFQLSIFINGLVVGISQIIAYPLCYFIITRLRRQYVAYACFSATFICSVILIFLWDQGSQTADVWSSIGVLIVIFAFRFAVSVEYTFFYVYFNELYPTQVRVLGTSLVSLMGGVMVTVAPQVIDACIQSGFPIMIIFSILSAFSCFFSYKLPQTFKKTPPDVIEQLRNEFNEQASILESEGGDIQGKERSTNYSSSQADNED